MLGDFKTVVRVATLGHAGHGKTTVATSLGRAALRDSGVYPFVEPFEVANEIASSSLADMATTATETTFETASRRYINADFATHADAVKGLVAGKPLQGVILVISAVDGVRDGTREQVALARSVGVRHVVVLLNQADRVADADLLGAREAEARGLLALVGFSAHDTMVVRGSARLPKRMPDGQGLRDLVVALDLVMPEAEPDHRLPFVMPVESAVLTPRGSLLSGIVCRGRVRPGQHLEVRGSAGASRVRCDGVEIARRAVKAAYPGDMCGLVVVAAAHAAVPPDASLVTQPEGAGCHARFVAEVYVLAQGGLVITSTDMSVGHPLEVLMLGAAVSATVTSVGSGHDGGVAPGEHATVAFALASPVTMEAGTRFTIRQHGAIVGFGVVTILQNV